MQQLQHYTNVPHNYQCLPDPKEWQHFCKYNNTTDKPVTPHGIFWKYMYHIAWLDNDLLFPSFQKSRKGLVLVFLFLHVRNWLLQV